VVLMMVTMWRHPCAHFPINLRHFSIAAANLRSDELPSVAVRNAEIRSQMHAQAQFSRQREEHLTKTLEQAMSHHGQLAQEVAKLNTELKKFQLQMNADRIGMRERVQRKGVKGRGGQSRMSFRPTLDYAEKQPTHVCEMPHQTLAELSMLGNHCAQRERLLREIMAADGISWGDAHAQLAKLDSYNEKFYWVESFPYRVGITGAIIAGIVGTLMVFSKPVAQLYAEMVAGEDLPEGVKDVSELTTNQVGTWTWSWMEPMIGTASFVLLCCQFGRTQAHKMNMKTYGEFVLQWRANRLARAFPQYDRSMVRAWAKHMPRVGLNFAPVYEKDAGMKGPTSGL